MNFKCKQTILAGTAALLFAAAIAVAGEADYSRLKKDVSVMENILKTEFERDDSLSNIDIRGHYLADQGALFTVSLPRHHSVFSFVSGDEEDYSSFVIRGAPPAPGAPAVDGFEIETFIDTAMKEAGQGMRMVGMDRESRKIMHDVAMDLREVERELAHINLEMIHAEENQKRSLEEQAAELEQDLAKLETRREKMLREIEQQAEARRAEREQRRAEREQQRRKQLARLEERLVQSLCDYGATLRSLPDNEHVSLIIDATDKERQIVVLDRKDVMNCSPGSDALQSRAIKYRF